MNCCDDMPWDICPITGDMRVSVLLASYIKAMSLEIGDTYRFNEFMVWIARQREIYCRTYGIALEDNLLPTREAQEQWERWLWKKAGKT